MRVSVVETGLDVQGGVEQILHEVLVELDAELLDPLVGLVLVEEYDPIHRKSLLLCQESVDVGLLDVRVQRSLEVLPGIVQVEDLTTIFGSDDESVEPRRNLHAESSHADRLDLDQGTGIQHSPVRMSDDEV